MADRALEIVAIKNPEQFGLDPSVLAVGDKILEVSGEKASDQLDWHFHASQGKSVSIKVQRADGRVENIVLPSTTVAGLEIWFEAMDFRRCRCKCVFCFVDQMPKGLRKSLYVKDEDFRLSFLYGNFTTMNDITDEELDKIIRQKNSPQWVSVHVVDEPTRVELFGRPMKRDIQQTLRKLATGGIAVHTQAVIVPGLNDGDRLRETIETLEAIHPNIVSMAVVPVGLTRQRDGLPGIRCFRYGEMGDVVRLVESFSAGYLDGPRGSRFVYASDEWYIGARLPLPEFDAYEGFPQLDNGVGVTRHLLSEIEADADAGGIPRSLGNIRIVTGRLGERVFADHVFPLLQRLGVRSLPEVVAVDNRFFGDNVTCSGLLVGEDIVAALTDPSIDRAPAGVTFIPPNCLNHEGVTIDEMTVGDISSAIRGPVVAPEDSLVLAFQSHAGGSDGTP